MTLCVRKRLALKTKNADRFLLLSARFVCYLVVVRVQSLPQREIVHFISTILTLEISPPKTAKTPIKSGFSGTISFLLSFADGGDESRTLVNILIIQRIYVIYFINTTLSTTLVPKKL